jgi:hypothetical protein
MRIAVRTREHDRERSIFVASMRRKLVDNASSRHGITLLRVSALEVK